MAIQGVDTKCYILALFIRDDDERFLLGSGQFEFKDSQKQFEANAIQNDVVEVQGNDGYLLAGQVRRSGTQNFDGYVGDGTMAKTEVEENRRKFFAFYQKNHFYRVVYVFPDGTAIQRKRGFLVDDPTVQELYQQYPEYHVALNFEDVNYYTYSENEQGEEIYAEEAIIDLSVLRATGGLIWDEYGAVSDGFAWGGETTVTGTDFQIQNELDLPAPVSDAKIYGDTEQQTYTGKNLMPLSSVSVDNNNRETKFKIGLPAGTYTISFDIDSFSLGTNTSFAVSMGLVNSSGIQFADRTIITINSSTTIGRKTFTFTTAEDASSANNSNIRVPLTQYNNGARVELSNIQIEAGSTHTDFEPYVGGVPAPNPDYPQQIQTVTGEQTVEVSGKNLFGIGSLRSTSAGSASISNGVITLIPTGTGNPIVRVNLIKPLPAGTYTLNSSTYLSVTTQLRNATDSTTIYNFSSNYQNVTFTTTDEAYMIRFNFVNPGNTDPIYIDLNTLQIEVGSTATNYETYRSQSYTVDLGTIELCKIGDYQDYIYQDADGDWYLHKECAKNIYVGANSEDWRRTVSGDLTLYFISEELARKGSSSPMKTNMFIWSSVSNRINYIYTNSQGAFVVISPTSGGSLVANTVADYKTWLSSHNLYVYYSLAEATDTKITDNTLIAQLNTLGKMKLFVGENNVLVSASGTNLPGELTLTYYTTLDTSGSGYIWEEGGSGGPTMVEIGSITNVYPIWTVKGPAVNPELSVLTTNTTLKYEGSVGANQTLVIDMMNKTAKLNGTSVIGNVAGDWVNFTPGINRVVYITDNADTPPSLIEWQEVVG